VGVVAGSASRGAAGRLAQDRQERSGESSVTPAQADEVALCYGWIDSQRKSQDERYFIQKYTPRRRGSSWSRINVQRAEALIAAGRMRAPGLAEIESAKADGRWGGPSVRMAERVVQDLLHEGSSDRCRLLAQDLHERLFGSFLLLLQLFPPLLSPRETALPTPAPAAHSRCFRAGTAFPRC
jgi:hypothetical protein